VKTNTNRQVDCDRQSRRWPYALDIAAAKQRLIAAVTDRDRSVTCWLKPKGCSPKRRRHLQNRGAQEAGEQGKDRSQRNTVATSPATASKTLEAISPVVGEAVHTSSPSWPAFNAAWSGHRCSEPAGSPWAVLSQKPKGPFPSRLTKPSPFQKAMSQPQAPLHWPLFLPHLP